MRFSSALSFFIALFAAFFISDAQALAQQNAGITIIPAFVEEAADPGGTITKSLKVTNESGEDKEYFIYKRNIKGVEAGGVPIFAEEEAEKTGYEITEWIELQSDKITVPAHGSTEVPLTIHVPDTATPGSHFGGIFISAEPPKMRSTGAGVGYEVASVISIRISGDIVDTARIRSFSTDKLFYSGKHVKFNARIENQGNILIRPRGPVTITSMFAGKPDVVMVNESLAGVFPGTMRDLDFEWNSDTIGFGRYEAIIALTYEGKEGQKTIDASLVFWVFPTKIILIGLGLLAAIFGLGYFGTRYYINQAIIRASGGRHITPQRYRRQVGISRFTFVMISIMVVVVFFLLILLIFFA